MKVYPTTTGCLCANSHPGSYTGQDAYNDMLPVIDKNDKDLTDVVQEEHMEEKQRKYVLRRLTPIECARLQGFPDWWCEGADGSDSAQYKLWGNGVALPCVCDVLGRIAEEVRNNG